MEQSKLEEHLITIARRLDLQEQLLQANFELQYNIYGCFKEILKRKHSDAAAPIIVENTSSETAVPAHNTTPSEYAHKTVPNTIPNTTKPPASNQIQRKKMRLQKESEQWNQQLCRYIMKEEQKYMKVKEIATTAAGDPTDPKNIIGQSNPTDPATTTAGPLVLRTKTNNPLDSATAASAVPDQIEIFAQTLLQKNPKFNFATESQDLNPKLRKYVCCLLPWTHAFASNHIGDPIPIQLLKFINKKQLIGLEGTTKEKNHAKKQLFIYLTYCFKLVPSTMYQLLVNYRRNYLYEEELNTSVEFQELNLFFLRNLTFSPSSYYCYLQHIDDFHLVLSA